jgi:hypothetical protein
MGGWHGDDPRRHADFIRPGDVPACWVGMRMTVDVEAKAKELAVLRFWPSGCRKHLRSGRSLYCRSCERDRFL